MKKFISKSAYIIASLVFYSLTTSALPAVDCADLNKAATNYIALMKQVGQEVAKAKDASAVVKTSDKYIKVATEFLDAMEAFLHKYPETLKSEVAPAECTYMQPAMLELFKNKPLAKRFGEELMRYKDDPKVIDAMKRLQAFTKMAEKRMDDLESGK
jgi:hypothetical protein